jgi:hypothetical protein
MWTVMAIVALVVIVVGWACCVVVGRADDAADRLGADLARNPQAWPPAPPAPPRARQRCVECDMDRVRKNLSWPGPSRR